MISHKLWIMNEVRRKAQAMEGLRPDLRFSEQLIRYGTLKVAIRRAEAAADRDLIIKASLDLALAEILFCFLPLPVGASLAPSKIAAQLGLSPTTVTSRLRRLEDLHYLTRETTPDDRRSLNALLTSDGEAALRRAVAVYSEAIENTFEMPDLGGID